MFQKAEVFQMSQVAKNMPGMAAKTFSVPESSHVLRCFSQETALPTHVQMNTGVYQNRETSNATPGRFWKEAKDN